jgi:hypothetical protein
MKKGSVFANKKGHLGNGYGTPINISSTSSSLFDNSLQQQNPLGSARNWQATPTNTRRLPHLHHQQLLHPSNSSTSIKLYSMAPTAAVISNTPNTSIINRAKPYTLQGLVENLNEVKQIIIYPLIHSLVLFFFSYLLNSVFLIVCDMKQNMALKIFLLFSMYVSLRFSKSSQYELMILASSKSISI